tara:strand:+ start:613 stop:1029 length:417 start_codon:yes stop_codon:yes gene_type:complete
MNSKQIQTTVILFLLFYDFVFLYNLYDYHHAQRDLPQHDTHYRPMYGLDDLRVLKPAHTMTVIHVMTSIAPLLGSLYQISKPLRSLSKGAKKQREFVLISAAISSYPALRLSLSISDNGLVESGVVVFLCLLWMLVYV